MTRQQLRKLRGERTQKEMAEMLGYHERYYQALELGEREISPKIALWIKHKIIVDRTRK